MEPIFVQGFPIGAVRMTRADVWKKRPAVLKYREWCDMLREAVTGDPQKKLEFVPAGIALEFFLPIPQSLSDKKRVAMAGTLHNVRPDIDNLSKAVMDALFEKDSAISWLVASKHFAWDVDCGVRITMLQSPNISSTLVSDRVAAASS